MSLHWTFCTHFYNSSINGSLKSHYTTVPEFCNRTLNISIGFITRSFKGKESISIWIGSILIIGNSGLYKGPKFQLFLFWLRTCENINCSNESHRGAGRELLGNGMHQVIIHKLTCSHSLCASSPVKNSAEFFFDFVLWKKYCYIFQS